MHNKKFENRFGFSTSGSESFRRFCQLWIKNNERMHIVHCTICESCFRGKWHWTSSDFFSVGIELRAVPIRYNNCNILGQSFNLVIVIGSIPALVAIYTKCIKVTVDGPREPRSKNSFCSASEQFHINLVGRHADTEQGSICWVATMTRITSAHSALGVEHLI